ncbi:hypothetical protein HPP92_009841 [Vanilla planifolia]|uniref:Uncharacterized protein n=1 Tax=Vanilla planifolia TaxID=51239 RepID=A0A835RGJ7_VANPL|nr:hypothetical protein HPP92_009841 [Vanilla planifolia]
MARTTRIARTTTITRAEKFVDGKGYEEDEEEESGEQSEARISIGERRRFVWKMAIRFLQKKVKMLW